MSELTTAVEQVLARAGVTLHPDARDGKVCTSG
jgi:hypothetical protein